MEKNENQKGSRGIIIALLIIIIVLLAALCVLFATGVINFRNKTTNNTINNINNSTDNTKEGKTTNAVETTILTTVEATNIVKELYNEDVRHIFNEVVSYCGERESGEGSYLSIDGFGYTKSKSFKTFSELENHLKKFMTESLLSSSNYNKSVVLNGKTIKNYIERDGSLYCNGWNKGSNMELAYYIENESTFEVNNIGETSFDAKINAVYYDVDYETNKSASTKTVKKIEVIVVKQNDNWLLDKYSELS